MNKNPQIDCSENFICNEHSNDSVGINNSQVKQNSFKIYFSCQEFQFISIKITNHFFFFFQGIQLTDYIILSYEFSFQEGFSFVAQIFSKKNFSENKAIRKKILMPVEDLFKEKKWGDALSNRDHFQNSLPWLLSLAQPN